MGSMAARLCPSLPVSGCQTGPDVEGEWRAAAAGTSSTKACHPTVQTAFPQPITARLLLTEPVNRDRERERVRENEKKDFMGEFYVGFFFHQQQEFMM